MACFVLSRVFVRICNHVMCFDLFIVWLRQRLTLFLAHSRCSANICPVTEGEGIDSNGGGGGGGSWKITQDETAHFIFKLKLAEN